MGEKEASSICFHNYVYRNVKILIIEYNIKAPYLVNMSIKRCCANDYVKLQNK